MDLKTFIWGEGGQALTPEQVAAKRELAELAAGRAGDTSPVGHWTQGATRVVDALGGVLNERRADRGEREGMASADEYIAGDPVLSSLIGGSPSVSAPSAAPVPSGGRHDHGSHAGQSHADWLRYSNQSATRNKPLDPKLVSALSFLPEMGVTMDVISGGQDGKGEGDRRTGSTRHDHGSAADVDFYMGDRKLDWNNPEDLPIFTDIVNRAAANGVTGIGAGDDYMGAGRMHVGFGNPGVWGAGGSGANAPSWLRDAYGGASGGQGGPAPTQASYGGAPMQDNSNVIAALSAGMSNPWVAKKYGPVLQSLMGQQMKRGDMDYQAQLQQKDPMYQAKLAQLTAPAEVDPFAGTQVINGQLVTMGAEGPQVLGDYRTQDEGYRPLSPDEAAQMGLPDGAYQVGPDGKVSQIGGGGVTVNNDLGGDKFDEAFAKGDAAMLGAVSESGLAAQRNIGRIDQLEGLLSQSPTGLAGVAAQKAGEWGINTDGLSEIQAAQALINSMVPEQRQPGSGPMSDADLALFKQSLPRIINQPGGNEMIIQTMRGIAQYDAEGAQIVQDLRSGQIGRAEAVQRLQSRKSPLEGFSVPAAPSGQAKDFSQMDASGIAQVDVMSLTPEEMDAFEARMQELGY